ncbi:MAG: choice-of-anchor U domain-containing protein [Candidatus Saccharimonadales bacterium]
MTKNILQPKYFINNTVNSPLSYWDFDTIWQTHSNTPPTFGGSTDTDGISTEVENAAPNSGDANNDGTPDAEQSNVASYVNPITGNYTVLAVDDSCEIQSVQSKAETEVGNDSGYQYPAGLMQFTIACGTPGFEAIITQYYYGTGGNYALRKYTPTAGYFGLSSASISDQTIAGQAVKVASYQVTDGSTLDTDGNEDGSITDPAGLAVRQQTQDAADLAGTGQSMPLYMILVGLLLGAVPAILVIEGRRL